ncbi:MAG TPA: oxidoreductase [Brevundimonas sp.]|nr:oxidoreductase [Brevundimonas sp.]
MFAEDGYHLIVAADTPLAEAVQGLEAVGATVEAVQVDLATEQGVQALYGKIGGRPVDALAANAGHGLGKGFLDESFEDILHVINTNITGTVRLAHLLGRDMRERGRGRILFTGSIAGLMPGSFQAVYNASKAFVDSFSFALRNELKDSGVSVTVLMPGPTDTEFFHRAGLDDTVVGQAKKMDAGDVAKIGYHAMQRGEGDVVAGVMNKVQAAMAAVTPQTVLAEMHRKQAEPGSAN